MANSDNLDFAVGQRLATGFPGIAMSEEFVDAVKRKKIANVILFAHNIKDKEQLSGLCADIQDLVRSETGHDALISIDQEGGAVTRLSLDACNVPGAMAIAATGDPENARIAGRITAEELAALGVNFNLAPVLDVNANPRNPVIGVRSYGDEADRVATFGIAMMEGLKEGGVLCAAKHFPGHGDTAVDSHLNLPTVDKSFDELMATDFAPFVAAIRAGVPAVMSSHILFPALEKERVPATMSRAIMTGLLKDRFGFGGLVVSDCMEMAAIREFYGTVEGTVAAVGAGVDLVFISHSPKLAADAAEAIKMAILDGRLHRGEAEASAAKLLAAKAALSRRSRPPLDTVGSPEHRSIVRALLAKSITAVTPPPAGHFALGASPFFVGPRASRATNASNAADPSFSFPAEMASRLGGAHLVCPDDPTREDIEAAIVAARGATSVVVGTYNGHLHRGQLDLVRALAAGSVPIAVVALRNPYDLAELPREVVSYAAYEYTASCFEAVAAVLSGTAKAPGRLPVKLR